MGLIANLATSVALAVVDLCNGHTWWLLNSELARTKRGERYMEKSATFFELDRYGLGGGSDLWSLDSDSEAGICLLLIGPPEHAGADYRRPWAGGRYARAHTMWVFAIERLARSLSSCRLSRREGTGSSRRRYAALRFVFHRNSWISLPESTA